MGHINYFSRKSIWAIIQFLCCYKVIVLFLCKALVGSLHEDLGEDLGSWTPSNSTLTTCGPH